MEIANSVEPVRDGRIHIEKINWPFLSEFKGSPAEYGAGLKLAIERGWLWMHESGTYVKLTQAGADLFAPGGHPSHRAFRVRASSVRCRKTTRIAQNAVGIGGNVPSCARDGVAVDSSPECRVVSLPVLEAADRRWRPSPKTC
jgi:hypothetical protein